MAPWASKLRKSVPYEVSAIRKGLRWGLVGWGMGGGEDASARGGLDSRVGRTKGGRG